MRIRRFRECGKVCGGETEDEEIMRMRMNMRWNKNGVDEG